MAEDWLALLPDQVRQFGEPIEPDLPFETLWPLSKAELLSNWFAANNYAVVGGDFYFKKNSDFVHSHEGWWCDLNKNEMWVNYCSRSVAEMLVKFSEVSIAFAKSDVWFTVVALAKPDAKQLAKIYAR